MSVATITPRQLTATIVVVASNSKETWRASWSDSLGRYLQCDGTADQVEIQAAISALPAGGGCVTLLEGTYNIAAQITIGANNISIVGSGKNATVLVLQSDGITTLVANGRTNQYLARLAIDLNGKTSGGFDYLNCTNVLVEQIAVTNGVKTNSACDIKFNDSSGIVVRDCYFEALWNFGGTDMLNALFENNEMNDFGHEGIILAYTNGLPGPKNIHVKHNYIHNLTSTAAAIDVNGSGDVWVEDNYIETVEGAGIYMEATSLHTPSNIHILNNKVFDWDTLQNYAAAIRVIRASGSGTIMYVDIRGNLLATSQANSDAVVVDHAKWFNISQNILYNSPRFGILISDSSDGKIQGNIIYNIPYPLRVGNNTTRVRMEGNYIDVNSLGAYCITETATGCDYNQIIHNTCINATGVPVVTYGIHTIAYRQHSDLFMDVLAVSANHVVIAQTLAADPTVCAIAAQPDCPRTLSYTITHPTLTAFTLTFVGVNAKGQTVTEVFTQATGWTGETSNAFATVTPITMSAMTGNTVADTIDVGITDVLGLSNEIYATSDVYKIKKNNANAVVATAQVNTTYDTYDMAVIGLAGGDDFTIYFRSNLNVVA